MPASVNAMLNLLSFVNPLEIFTFGAPLECLGLDGVLPHLESRHQQSATSRPAVKARISPRAVALCVSSGFYVHLRFVIIAPTVIIAATS